VVSIVALLVALLLPALGAAREAAKMTQCASNARMLATASRAYAADHDDRIVPIGDSLYHWHRFLDPYLGMGRVYPQEQRVAARAWLCPSNMPKAAAISYPGPVYSNGWLSLRFLNQVTGNGAQNEPAPRYSEARRPHEKVLIGEIYCGEGSPNGFTSTVYQLCIDNQNRGFWHRGTTMNIAWVDGHVTAMNQSHDMFLFTPTTLKTYYDFDYP